MMLVCRELFGEIGGNAALQCMTSVEGLRGRDSGVREVGVELDGMQPHPLQNTVVVVVVEMVVVTVEVIP